MGGNVKNKPSRHRRTSDCTLYDCNVNSHHGIDIRRSHKPYTQVLQQSNSDVNETTIKRFALKRIEWHVHLLKGMWY